MNGFVLMLYIILESLTKFWVVFGRQARKRWKLFLGRRLRTKQLGEMDVDAILDRFVHIFKVMIFMYEAI